MSLDAYRKKRDFKRTPEPKGTIKHTLNKLYVIQKHAASHLHYDFRLEMNGTLKSWAVPKGPCLDPSVKRLAVLVEDHPIAYGSFEGIIPKGEYGAGTVMVWDTGEWHCLDADPVKAFKDGHLRIELHAEKLNGRWDLIRSKDAKNWLLIKGRDNFAKPLSDYDITLERPDSVLGQRAFVDNKKTSLFANLPESPFPEAISPQLATLVDKPPESNQWMHEIKFDGYRMLAFKQGKSIHIKSRNHHDWTMYFPTIVRQLRDLPVQNAIVDGEIILEDKQGRSNFQLLQNAIKNNANAPFQYYIFDCIYAEKYNLKSLALLQRKAILKQLLGDAASVLHYSEHMIGDGAAMYSHACDLGLEGIVSKDINSHYVETRSKSWLKTKCVQRQEFVIGGYSEPTGRRKHFGSLYLGVFNEASDFIYCGKVGTGFTSASLKEIYSELQKNQSTSNPFDSNITDSHVHWVKPVLVAEVKFSEWTKDDRLRHPSFQGLRLDKKAAQVKKEKETPVNTVKEDKPSSHKNAVKITHPNKLIYLEDTISKQDIFNYYEEISEVILPFIINRPLTLLRCPDTYTSCFYQRHPWSSKSSSIHSIKITNNSNQSDKYLYITAKEGLFDLIQHGVLEIHPWSSTLDALETPDMIIFDLDPAPDVSWHEVVAAAFDIKRQLEHYKLICFVKTTGGQGLHVVIPIQPKNNWDVIKLFTHVFVEFMERNNPTLYISKMSKSKRCGKIFIDYLRNQKAASAISPYSSRARRHAPVATPLNWDELTNNIQDTLYTIQTLPARLHALSSNPWENFWHTKQELPSEAINFIN